MIIIDSTTNDVNFQCEGLARLSWLKSLVVVQYVIVVVRSRVNAVGLRPANTYDNNHSNDNDANNDTNNSNNNDDDNNISIDTTTTTTTTATTTNNNIMLLLLIKKQ